MAGDHADVQKHVRMYIGVLMALAVFTVVTVLASRIHVSAGVHVVVALLIAGIKAGLVAAIFMHLKWERGVSIWWTLFFCAVFFVTLMLLPTLAVGDAPPRVETTSWQ